MVEDFINDTFDRYQELIQRIILAIKTFLRRLSEDPDENLTGRDVDLLSTIHKFVAFLHNFITISMVINKDTSKENKRLLKPMKKEIESIKEEHYRPMHRFLLKVVKKAIIFNRDYVDNILLQQV
jgi:hypothetical protein